MVHCSAYGLNITPAQCAMAQAWFRLSRVCGDCPGPNYIIAKPPKAIIRQAGGVQRTSRGPTLTTALRQLSISNKSPKVPNLSNKSPKKEKLSSTVKSHTVKSHDTKPRRPCPPGMTPAVARRLGLL